MKSGFTVGAQTMSDVTECLQSTQLVGFSCDPYGGVLNTSLWRCVYKRKLSILAKWFTWQQDVFSSWYNSKSMNF